MSRLAARRANLTRRRALGVIITMPAAIMATRRAAADDRRFLITGEDAGPLASLDAAVEQFMRQQSIRSGALAVARRGKLVFDHAYTWAQPDYPQILASAPFRLASVSKVFTAALIDELVQAGALDLDLPVFRSLGYVDAALASQRIDPRLATITVQHLINHRGGWDSHASRFDPVFRMREVARQLGLLGAPTKHDIARFMVGEPLQFEPGNREAYSNFGYLMLGLAAEQAAGSDYLTAVKARVSGPIGVDEVFLARTRRDRRLPGEGFYDQPGSGLTPEFPDREVRAPLPYGGGDWLTESMDACAGLAASAGAVARLIGHYAVWGFGLRRDQATWARSGIMSGTTSFAISRADGLDFCVIFNTRTQALDRLTLEITRVLDAVRPT